MFSQNQSLTHLNTFGLSSKAAWYVKVECESDFLYLLENDFWRNSPFFILGGGSNVLLPEFYDGYIIHICNKGIKIIHESTDFVIIETAAGEVWEDFVEWSVSKGYSGIENLALIPGFCGSSPVQNIGAYGVEVKDVIESVNYYDLTSNTLKSISKEACKFEYRHSIFKSELRNKAIVKSVVFRLSKKNDINLTYSSLVEYFKIHPIEKPQIRDIYDAVVSIRRSKLPDHKQIGNAGSFFKNPIINVKTFIELSEKIPNLAHWKLSETTYKIAAAQLIELSGWKGKRIGDAGVHTNQALVLVNYGNANGEDIFNLAKSIIADVFLKFNIDIEPEVNILI